MKIKLLKRSIEFKIRKLRDFIINNFNKITSFLLDAKCSHKFRPAKTLYDEPAEFCNHCNELNRLTPEEYYSKYGEVNWQNWK